MTPRVSRTSLSTLAEAGNLNVGEADESPAANVSPDTEITVFPVV